MTFEEILDEVLAMLERRGRVTYRTLKRQFHLDDDAFEDLKDELLYAHPHVVEDDGRGLIWRGETHPTPTPGSPPAPDQEHTPLSYTPSHLTDKILQARPSLAGERKQVTVLFADLRGSMELLANCDPEEARALLNPVLERMMAAVHRYEGTVNQVMGDGIMALFGAPIAHEDHAARACYAALAMQEAIRRYGEEARRAHGVMVQIRVGLNSGAVVVRAIGNDLHMDYSAIGQTTHLAARMEQLASPGSILMTAETLRLAEGVLQVTPLGPVPVKGLAEPLEVYEVRGAGPVRSRLQAAARGFTRFVGRDTELDQLRRALERASAGQGQVVAVIGEPGVGKSRLVWEFLHSHRTHGWLLLESRSMSYGKATPNLPIIDLLKAYCAVETPDDTRRAHEQVTGKLLTLDRTLEPTLPAVLALLDVPVEDAQWQALDPPQRWRQTFEAMRRLLLRESRVQPLLLICEDLHWMDSETQAVLDSLVESLPTARLLLLVNYRPEYQHGWGSKTSYTQLRLDPLPPTSAAELLRALLGEDASFAPLHRVLIERTEGNPFFLEESVRTLMEIGVLVGEPGVYRLAPQVGAAPHGRLTVGHHREVPRPIDIQVPATVQSVLAARIDRLPAEDKRLLQTSAVLGTEVSFPVLQAIAGVPEADLHRGLAHLQAAEFLYETRLFPEREYTFKHALTHEVAYGSLLHERRHALHGQIVEAIERLYPNRLSDHVERLAHHAVRGDLWEKAVTYLRQAGAKAFARSANREAVASFEQVLTALSHLPETRETQEQAVEVRFDLCNALFPLAEFGRIEGYLREAERLALTLDDQRRLGWVSTYMSGYHWSTGGHTRDMRGFAQRAEAIGETLGDVPLQVAAQYHLIMACHLSSDYRGTEHVCRRLMQSIHGERTHGRFGVASFPAVLLRAYLAFALAERGEFDEGDAHGREAIRMAEALDHPYSLVLAYLGLAYLDGVWGELNQAALAQVEGR